MRLLLDTHAPAWWTFDDPRMPVRVRDLIASRENEVFVSVVSAFECATKFRIGKWKVAAPLVYRFDDIVASEGFGLPEISLRHAACAGPLSGKHRDPFDRLLAAQAEIDELKLVTINGRIKQLGAETIW